MRNWKEPWGTVRSQRGMAMLILDNERTALEGGGMYHAVPRVAALHQPRLRLRQASWRSEAAFPSSSAIEEVGAPLAAGAARVTRTQELPGPASGYNVGSGRHHHPYLPRGPSDHEAPADVPAPAAALAVVPVRAEVKVTNLALNTAAERGRSTPFQRRPDPLLHKHQQEEVGHHAVRASRPGTGLATPAS